MELISKTINLPKEGINLYAFGDLHIASIAFEEAKFRKLIKTIKEDENGYWIGMGDFGDCISRQDKRFEQESLRERYRNKIHILPQLEAEELKTFLSPIKDKCLLFLRGNHEDALRKYYSYDLTWELCNYFNFPYGSEDAFLRLTLKNHGKSGINLDIFACHGYGNSRKWGSRLNKLSDLFSSFEAQIYLMAHQHSEGLIKEVRLSLPQKGKLDLVEKVRLGVCVPSFYKTYQVGTDTYSSKRLFPPSSIGYTKIMINLKREAKRDKVMFSAVV